MCTNHLLAVILSQMKNHFYMRAHPRRPWRFGRWSRGVSKSVGVGLSGAPLRSGGLFHSTSGRRLLPSPPTLRSIPQTTKPLQSLARCRTLAYCPPFLVFRHSRSLGLELVPLRRADDGFVSLRHRQAASATPGPSQGLFHGSTSCLTQATAQA